MFKVKVSFSSVSLCRITFVNRLMCIRIRNSENVRVSLPVGTLVNWKVCPPPKETGFTEGQNIVATWECGSMPAICYNFLKSQILLMKYPGISKLAINSDSGRTKPNTSELPICNLCARFYWFIYIVTLCVCMYMGCILCPGPLHMVAKVFVPPTLEVPIIKSCAVQHGSHHTPVVMDS